MTEQFHEYLTPYGKNKNEFVVRTDNNPLTYIFSSAHLDAAGHWWVASLADYNFSLEYQKVKDNTVADFLSHMENHLPEEEVEEVLRRVEILAPGVKAMLDNADTPITERAEGGDDALPIRACLAKTLSACPVKYTTLQVVDWKKAQREDPALSTLVKNLRSSKEDFMRAMCKVLNPKAARAYENRRDGLILKNGLLYHKTLLTKTGEDLWHFIVPKSHRGVALDGCHREAAHQGQRHSISLMQEQFWWPGMTREMINKVKNCARCKKYEGTLPIAKLQKLPCSGPGELLHIDFTTIEETVGLNEEPVIRNVLIMQDHFSKHVVAYVVKDQKARTAAEALCSGYFGLFGAPAYLLSDKGKSFTATVVEDLCTLYGVKKLRTSSYHAQTNGQVERMNQTLIHLIGKLDEDKKACWSKHLPELLMAYNSMRSVVTGYSPHFLLFGRRPRIPVDYLFPTLRDTPHKSKLEESVALHQKRLKEAFVMARQLTSEEAARQQCHYDRRAGAITLQPGDIVIVRTDRFVGKHKVKDRWEEVGYVIVNQLEDWPVYKVKCPPSENKRKAKYLTLHRNCLMLVPPGDDKPQDPTQLKVVAAIVLNANIGTILYDGELDYSDSGTSLPSLLNRQGVDKIPHVWLNGESHTQLFTQVESEAIQSPQDSVENDVSDPEPVSTDSDDEEM